MSSENAKVFLEFIKKHRLGRDDDTTVTHTFMGAPYGKYNFSGLNYDKFLRLYKRAMGEMDMHCVERQMEVGPIVVDIDFKHKEKDRQYTEDHVKGLVRLYNRYIKKYLDTDNQTIKAFVLEKKTPSYDKNNEEYKDGFHIIYPDIPVDVSFRYFLLDKIKNIVKETEFFNDIPICNTIDDIFDVSVVFRNGLLMVQSKKEGREPYDLTAVYTHDLKEEELKNYPDEDLVSVLSFRRYDSDDEVGLKDQSIKEELSKYKNGMPKIEQDKPKGEKLQSELPKATKTGGGGDAELAKKLVEILSVRRATEYNLWICVCWALHNISDQLFETFVEFSKRCAGKFSMGKCIEVWKNAKSGGYTIASLCQWAKEDDPKGYAKVKRGRLNDFIKNAGSGSHDDIANMIHEMYKYDFVCVSIAKKKWYEFRNNRWFPVEEGYTLSEKISNEVAKEFSLLVSGIMKNAADAESIDVDDIQKKGKKIFEIIQKLKTIPFKKSVMEACSHKFYEKGFMEKLDANPYLLGFDNGVYDLKAGLFRQGSPDDYISFSVGYDYKDFDESDPLVRDVLGYFSQTHIDPQMREYTLKFIASMCDGVPMQTFNFWTGKAGKGSNGKSSTSTLIKKAFGDYYGIMPHSVITQKRGKGGSAFPELADKAGKRVVFLQEAEQTDVIYVGQMKELTGSDMILARALFSDPFYFVPQFQLIMTVNKLPNIPSTDGGTWRRTRVNPWESEFIKGKITKSNQFPMDEKLSEKFDDWKQPFMWLLLSKYYKSYVKNGLEEPAKVTQFTGRYKKHCDIYLEFIRDFLKEVDENESENIHAMYSIFKSWYRESYSEKPPPKKDFIEEMTNKGYEATEDEIFGLKISYDSKYPKKGDDSKNSV